MKGEKKYVGVGIVFGIDVKSPTHSCANRHQTWALGISWVRWWTVPTHVFNQDIAAVGGAKVTKGI